MIRQGAEDFLNQYNLDLEAQIDVFCVEGDRSNYKTEWIPAAIS